MALEPEMQGGRRLLCLAIFLQLACSSPPRQFSHASAGTSAGGTSASSASAGSGAAGRSSTGGSSSIGNGGSSASAGSGEDVGAGNTSTTAGNGTGGAAPAGMCAAASDCAALPHVRQGAPTACNAGHCAIPASSCEAGYGHCTSSDLEFCETNLNTATDCGTCGKKCPISTPFCEVGACVGSCKADPENCFNGKDDDCDGKIDCADSDCNGPAQCVPAETWAYGTSIAAQGSCPTGFLGGSSTVHGVLSGGNGNGCSGCGCNPTYTDCAPYTVTLSRTTDSCGVNGTVVSTFTIAHENTSCSAHTVASAWNELTFTSTPKFNCTNTGTPTVSPATWTDDSKFCTASAAGSGCGTGNVCVPTAPGSACLLASGSQECPSFFPKKRALYTAFRDNRVCSCSCAGEGGACDRVRLGVSFTSTCAAPTPIPLNGLLCLAEGTTASELGYFFSGTLSDPTACSASNVATGGLTPTGPQTLCCQ